MENANQKNSHRTANEIAKLKGCFRSMAAGYARLSLVSSSLETGL